MGQRYRARELFAVQASSWGLDVAEEQLETLLAYTDLLSGYERANVVGEKDRAALLIHHVLDSLSCLLVPELQSAEALVDVGSGGGLPGIPLAVVRPRKRTTLLEATAKKAAFLELAVEELELRSVRILNERAEEAGRVGHRAGYRVATARAVASLAVLVEYCLPLVEVGGVVVAMKAEVSEEELRPGVEAARMLGGRVREVLAVPLLPEVSDRRRTLVVVEKVGETPMGFPRRPGLPRKQPLGGSQP